jgi:hypothetical protein
MLRISDRRPSAVSESKYPRDAPSTPDVESLFVRSSGRYATLIWRRDRPLRLMMRLAGKLPIGDPPDARTGGIARRLPWRRVAGRRRRGTAPPLPRHAAGARTDPGRPRSESARRQEGDRRLRPATYQASVTPQDPTDSARLPRGLELLTRGDSNPRRRRGPSGAAPRRRSRALPPCTGRASYVGRKLPTRALGNA